jgi:hypothetical protein
MKNTQEYEADEENRVRQLWSQSLVHTVRRQHQTVWQIKDDRTFSDSWVLCIFTGMVNQNLDPRSSSDATPITPPINLTNCRDMESPSPVPPKRRVEEFWWRSVNEVNSYGRIHTSACWKGTNNWSTSLAERPIPVSLRSIICLASRSSWEQEVTYCISNLRWTSPGDELGISPTEQSTSTDPAAVNLTAFPMRFIKTEQTRSSSDSHDSEKKDPTLSNPRIIRKNPCELHLEAVWQGRDTSSIHGGTSGWISKERSSFWAAIGSNNSMQSF